MYLKGPFKQACLTADSSKYFKGLHIEKGCSISTVDM